jgi:hypothetical protein
LSAAERFEALVDVILAKNGPPVGQHGGNLVDLRSGGDEDEASRKLLHCGLHELNGVTCSHTRPRHQHEAATAAMALPVCRHRDARHIHAPERRSVKSREVV